MRRPVVAIPLVPLLLLAACSASSAADQRTSLCEDLGHLQATIAVVASPPPGATVGDVRSALEKLESTFGEIDRVGTLAETTRTELSEARLDYLDALSSTGDDDPIDEVRGTIAGPAHRLARDLDALLLSLRCAEATSTP